MKAYKSECREVLNGSRILERPWDSRNDPQPRTWGVVGQSWLWGMLRAPQFHREPDVKNEGEEGYLWRIKLWLWFWVCIMTWNMNQSRDIVFSSCFGNSPGCCDMHIFKRKVSKSIHRFRTKILCLVVTADEIVYCITMLYCSFNWILVPHVEFLKLVTPPSRAKHL